MAVRLEKNSRNKFGGQREIHGHLSTDLQLNFKCNAIKIIRLFTAVLPITTLKATPRIDRSSVLLKQKLDNMPNPNAIGETPQVPRPATDPATIPQLVQSVQSGASTSSSNQNATAQQQEVTIPITDFIIRMVPPFSYR